MSGVTFVRTRHVYDSYQDWYRLIELSGYPTCYVDEIDPSRKGHTYILGTRNGEWGEGWKKPKARLIFFNLEWTDYPPIAGIAGTWCADKWFAREIGARYVPLGGHAGLRDSADSAPEMAYDVAFLGYIIPRRQQMQHDLKQVGLTLSPSSAWGSERHTVLAGSRVYGHIHQHESKPGIPALRLVVAAAYGLPFITEQCADAGRFADVIMQAPYHYFAGFTRDWLRDEWDMLKAKGEALRGLLCEDWTFRKSVEAAL